MHKRDPTEGIDLVATIGGNHAVSGLKFGILFFFFFWVLNSIKSIVAFSWVKWMT